MILTKENIGPYLLERAFVDPEAAIAGDLVIVGAPTRNNVFKVVQARGRSCFIKQPFKFDAATIQLLAREASSYQLIFGHAAYRAASAALPRLVGYDPERHVLAVEYVRNTTSVHEMILKRRSFFPELAARMGVILARFHFPVPHGAELACFPRHPPWVLLLPDADAAQFFPDHAAVTGLLNTVKAHSALAGALRQLRSEWRIECLIHNDVKWANFIASADDPEFLRLIDWELADIGDAAWDVAGLLQSYVSAWIFGFDDSNPTAYDLPAGTADFEISRMHGSVQRFWAAYVAERGLEDGQAAELLGRSVRLLACRMIQTAAEGAMKAATIPPNSMRAVQAAFNILQRPKEAAAELLGLP